MRYLIQVAIQTARAGTPRVISETHHKELSMEKGIRLRLLSEDNRDEDSSPQRIKNAFCYARMALQHQTKTGTKPYRISWTPNAL